MALAAPKGKKKAYEESKYVHRMLTTGAFRRAAVWSAASGDMGQGARRPKVEFGQYN